MSKTYLPFPDQNLDVRICGSTPLGYEWVGEVVNLISDCLTSASTDVLQINTILIIIKNNLNLQPKFNDNVVLLMELSNLKCLTTQISKVLVSFDFSIPEHYLMILCYLLKRLKISLEGFAASALGI